MAKVHRELGSRNIFKPGPGATRVCEAFFATTRANFAPHCLELGYEDSGVCISRGPRIPRDGDGLSGSWPQWKHGLFVADLKYNWRHLRLRVDQSEVTSILHGRYQEQHLFSVFAQVIGKTSHLVPHWVPSSYLAFIPSLGHISAWFKDLASVREVQWSSDSSFC